MSDLFHEALSNEDIAAVFEVMAAAPQHKFQILTKRPKRMREWFGWKAVTRPLPNVWLGVSAEDQATYDERIGFVHGCPAAKWFVSLEPLLGPIDLRGTGRLHLDWVIAGGESGNGSRPMHPGWALSLADQCAAAGIPFFFKQWGDWKPVIGEHARQGDVWVLGGGGVEPWRGLIKLITEGSHVVPYAFENVLMRRIGKKKSGRLLDGRIHEAFPE